MFIFGSEADEYRLHPVWGALDSAVKRLGRIQITDPEWLRRRSAVVSALQYALLSRKNVVPVVFDDQLEELHRDLDVLGNTAQEFESWFSQNFDSVKQIVRELPGPIPTTLADKRVEELEEVATSWRREVESYRKQLADSNEELREVEQRTISLSNRLKDQNEEIALGFARVTAAAEQGSQRADDQVASKLSEVEARVAEQEASFEQRAADEITKLALAARVGDKLVERAAGTLTAKSWTERATRERRNAVWMRVAALAAYVVATSIGAVFVLQTVNLDTQLSPGSGLLRGLVVASIVGVGSILTLEQRRHFREADTAEEVSIAIQAMDPFFARSEEEASGSGEGDRDAARRDLADAVFVTNILSRFNNRDSTKHGSLSAGDIDSLVDTVGKKITSVQGAGRNA